MRQLRWGWCGALTVLLLQMTGVCEAQTRAYTVRASQRRVILEVTVTNAERIQLTVHDGELARLKVDGVLYGVAPYISNIDSGSARIFVARIKKAPRTKDEIVEQVAELDARLGGEPVSFGGAPFEIAVQRLLPPRQATDGATAKPIIEPDGSCCVTCGGISACACAVSMSCGSCCADPCCGGGGGDPCSPCYPDRPTPGL